MFIFLADPVNLVLFKLDIDICCFLRHTHCNLFRSNRIAGFALENDVQFPCFSFDGWFLSSLFFFINSFFSMIMLKVSPSLPA